MPWVFSVLFATFSSIPYLVFLLPANLEASTIDMFMRFTRRRSNGTKAKPEEGEGVCITLSKTTHPDT
jgi:hypothetical protein